MRASRSSAILLLVERQLPLASSGQTFALYVVLYTFARFWFENMRIDPAHEIGRLRVNAWVSSSCSCSAIGWFVWLGRHEPRAAPPGRCADVAVTATAVATDGVS